MSAPVPGEPSEPPISAPVPAPIAAPANVSFARGLPKHPVIVTSASAAASVIIAAREIREGYFEFIFTKNLENVLINEYERGGDWLHAELPGIARFGVVLERVHAAANSLRAEFTGAAAAYRH